MAFYSLAYVNEPNNLILLFFPSKNTPHFLSPVDSSNNSIYTSTVLAKLYPHTAETLEILLLIS